MKDTFTFTIAAITAIAALVDFLMGESGRKRIRDKVTDWWIVVAELSYIGIAQRELNAISNGFQKVLGSTWKSVRFLLPVSIFSLLLTTLILVYSIPFYEGQGIRNPELWWVSDGLSKAEFSMKIVIAALSFEDLITGLYIGNLLGDGMSLWIAMVLLKRMAGSQSTHQLLRIAILDVCLAVSTFIGIFFLVLLFDTLSAGSINIFRPFIRFIPSFWDFIRGDMEIISIMLPAVTALFPTAIHFTFILLSLATKLFTPILQKPTVLLLERLAEVKTGIITLVVGAFCVLLKLLQLGIKAFG